MCDDMDGKRKSWKVIFNPYLISLVALGLAAYTFWDNNFHFKLDVAAGKQVKLFVGHIDEGDRNPVILMSLALTNSDGKTECVQDVKLNVTLTSKNSTLWHKEFPSMREYDTLLSSGSSINQVELLPIVIVGKTTEVRKYVFYPIENIQQNHIPKSFDLTITVYTKYRSSWKANKTYEVKNVSDVLQDLDNQDKWNFAVRDIFQKN